MTEDAVLDAIAHSWPHNLIHHIAWLYAVGQTAHFIGMSFLMGAILVVDLRLLGLMKVIPLRGVLPLLNISIYGFLLNMVSGVMFFISNPLGFWPNPAFKMKMALVFIAGLNAIYFQQVELRPILAMPDQHGGTDARTKFVASLSLLLWLLVIFFGRAMPAFVGSTSLF